MSDKCQSCGAAIDWLVTGTGRRIPVDPAVLTIHVARGGPVVIVDDAGMVHRGVLPEDSAGLLMPEVVSGRVSHFASCPDAPNWRGKTRGAK